MFYMLLGALAFLGLYVLASALAKMTASALRRLLLVIGFVTIGAGMIFFALMGRYQLAAPLGFVLLWLVRLWRVWQMVGPAASAMRQENGRMSRAEAFEILGLEEGADRAAIEAAYRELIVKNHPDQGGTDWLAARLNEARDVLLEP